MQSHFLARNLLISPRRLNGITVALLVAAALGFLAYIARMNSVTHDLYHAMALARIAFTEGVFPTSDRFAFTPTVDPSVHHEWGTGALLYMTTVASGTGPLGLMFVKFALVAGIALCCYRVCRMRGGDPKLFAIMMLIVLPMVWVGFTTLRAQLLTLAAIALQMVMFEEDWRGKKHWIWGWLAMYVVWLNLHAGFIVGAGMIAFHSIERIVDLAYRHRSIAAVWKGTWHLWCASPLAVLGLFINPYGVQYIEYLIHGLTMPRTDIAEWGPLWTTYDPFPTMFCFVISVGLIAIACRDRQWSRLRGMAFLLICALMCLKHIRHGSIYGIVWLAYVPAWISHVPLGHRWLTFLRWYRPRITRYAWCASIVFVVFAFSQGFWMPSVPGATRDSVASFPVGAVNYLERHRFAGNLITDFGAGAYVSWRLYPQVKVSLDGRYEVAYQEGVYESHNQLYKLEEGWEEVLDLWPADALLVPTGSALGDELQQRWERKELLAGKGSQWRGVYRDEGYMVWIREESQAASAPLLPVEEHHGPSVDGVYP